MKYLLLTLVVAGFVIPTVINHWNDNDYKGDFQGTVTGDVPNNELTDSELYQGEQYGTVWYRIAGKTATGSDTTIHAKCGPVVQDSIYKGKTAFVQYYQSFAEIIHVR